MLRLLTTGFAMLLGGCAGLQVANTTTSDEPLTVEASQSAGYDYLIAIRPSPSLRFDPRDQEARDKEAIAALKNECEKPQIVSDSVVKSGEQIVRYEIKVSC